MLKRKSITILLATLAILCIFGVGTVIAINSYVGEPSDNNIATPNIFKSLNLSDSKSDSKTGAVFETVYDEDWYKVTLAEAGNFAVEVVPSDSNTNVSLAVYGAEKASDASKAAVVSANDKGKGVNEAAVINNAAKGDYYILVKDLAGPANTSYDITVKLFKFSDYSTGHWAASYIDYLVARSIINGYSDGSFKPENNCTRAELIKMLVTAKKLNTAGLKADFKDAADHWATAYIAAAKKDGWISGYPDGTFKPDQKVTRAEIAKMVYNAFGLTETAGASFSDVSASHWAAKYINTMKANNIITGYPDGTFKPEQSATRAEVATMIAKTMQK